MKRFYVLLLVGMSLVGQPAWDDTLDHTAIEQRLSTERIVKSIDLRAYLGKKGIFVHPTHEVLVVELESGLKGVFKKGAYHHAEVAAYRASKALGIRLVPPTVYRKVRGMKGSLQFLIEAPQVGGISSIKKLTKKVGPKAVSDMRLFYYVFGQWDTHKGNQLVARYGDRHYLALIDNAVMLHRTYDTYGGATYTSKGANDTVSSESGSSFPYDKVKTISGRKAASVFKPFVGPSERHRLAGLSSVAYVVWQNRMWIRLSRRLGKRFTQTFYQSTLDAYKQLNEELLRFAWQGWAERDAAHAEDLVQLVLARRDEIMAYAYTEGMIYEG